IGFRQLAAAAGRPSSSPGRQCGDGEYPPTPISRSWMRPVRKTQSPTAPSSRSGIASVSKPILSAELERSKSAPRYGSQVSLSTSRRASAVPRHGVALDQLLVELESEAGPVRERKTAVRVDPRP